MATITNPPTTGLLDWAAFEQLPDDGMHYEIIEGVLISLRPPKSRHSLIARKTWKQLLAIESQAHCLALAEAGYKLGDDPPTWVQPDVSFLSIERIANTDPDGYFLGAPSSPSK